MMENKSEQKDKNGGLIGIHLLKPFGYDERFLFETPKDCSWDLEYRFGEYLELIEVKLRRYLLHQFGYWVYEDNKRKNVILEERCVNAVKQIQVFEDGFHIKDVTKIALVNDVDYRKRDTIEDWQSNDYGGANSKHRGSKYTANDLGYNEFKFDQSVPFKEMIENNFNVNNLIIIK